MWPTTILNKITATSATAQQANICPLPSFSIIEVKGVEAAKFLQGQLSCDVNLVTTEQFSLGTHNTAKGRMISSFRLFSPEENCYWLLLDITVAEIALNALKKYIIFSKADICLRTDLLAYISQGSSPQDSQADKLNHIEQQVVTNTGLIAQISNQQQVKTLLHIESSEQAIERLDNCTQLHNEATLLQLQYEQGLAFVSQNTSESFIAQMLNYQNSSAINFKKGCYTGQEIVARTHYKGNIKRKLYQLILNSESAFEAGNELSLKKDDGSFKSIVTIAASVSSSTTNQQLILAVTTAETLNIKALYTESETCITIDHIEACEQ